MTDYNYLVPVVANAAVQVTGNITSLVTRSKANGVMQRAQLEMLKEQTAKVLADARAYHAGDIIITNLEQIARTQEYIDNLEKQGRLHGTALTMAMDQLSDLNNMLRFNLRRYQNGELR